MPGLSLREYLEQLFGPEDELLRRLRQEAEREAVPLIQVPPELGRLLQLLILQTQASRVLELGTLFGHSAILMAQVMPANGKLTTVEVDPGRAALAQRNVEAAGVASKVRIAVGPALDVLASLEESSFDLVFIDADKQNYPDYLTWALKLTHPGSIIVADNVWREGAVASPEASDAANQGVARFNRETAANPVLHTTIIPHVARDDAASVSLVLTADL
jgi:predicted O-methyltransferase YrrM